MVIADLKNKILKVLGFSGTVQDQEFKFFKSEGVSSKTYPEAFMEWLSGLGFGSGSLQDRLKAYLSFLGFTGAIQDAEEKALTNGIFYDTIPLRVKNILSKYNATLLLPGPAGTVSYWFQPGNYRESTGQSLAAVDQQAGLLVDAAKAPGPECAIYAHETWSAGGGAYTKSVLAWGGVGGSNLTVGKTYLMSFTVAAITAGSSLDVYRRNAANTSNELVANINVVVGGSYSVVVPVVTDLSTYDIWVDNNTFNGTLTNFSVRELPGTQAAQATSGFQPYLRKVPKTLGPELRAGFSPNVIGVATPAVYDAAAGAATLYRVDVNNQSRLGISGLDMSKKYLVEVTNNGPASISVRTNNGANVKVNALAGERISYVAELETTPDLMIVGGTNGSSASISGISVREVIEWTYAWQFDGTDDRLSLSAVPFQMADDHFVIAAGVKTGGADGDLFSARNNTGPTQIVGVVRINAAGTLLCVYRDDANTLIQSGIAGVVPLNTPFVAALRKTGHRKSIRRDSGSWVHEDTPMGATTVNVATIGGSMSNAFGQGWPGYMHMIAIGKGAITDGEVRELERFAAKLQGRNL